MTERVRWSGSGTVGFEPAQVYAALDRLEDTAYVLRGQTGKLGAATGGQVGAFGEYGVLAAAAPVPPERLGSAAFQAAHGVRYSYMSGAMANGIASEELVIALARAGYLASFGAAGLLPERIEKALDRFAAQIPGLPYAANLIHSPSEERLERTGVDLFLSRGVRCVEASAFMDLTPNIVRYRVAGLSRGSDGAVVAHNRVIAKVSRPEVAERFIRPAPEAILAKLLAAGDITAEQAELARLVPVADDITVEADSGGHTDRRPLPALLPVILRQRDQIVREYGYAVRVGAAGGIGTPDTAAAAFFAGADYIVTGSVNQSCVEAGTSVEAKALLAQAGIADCDMAPAADMFEMGVELQVLRRGTLFPMRAKQLYEIYRTCAGIDAIPADARQRIEKQLFRRPLEEVWTETVEYFERRDPEQIARAADNPKRKMALIFRWYLGMSSRWAKVGDGDRVPDYQIWCGPAMGSFNAWVHGTYLAAPENRYVVDVARHLVRGAAFHQRVAALRAAGIQLSPASSSYLPAPAEDAEPVAALR
jgi:trans-AT polyketide synthase, acyltransferase and oxidoreductase domains